MPAVARLSLGAFLDRERGRWADEESRTIVIIESRNLREQLRRCEHLEEAELKPDPFAVARTHTEVSEI